MFCNTSRGCVVQMIVTIVGITNSKKDHLLLLVYVLNTAAMTLKYLELLVVMHLLTQIRLCVWQDKLASLVLARTSKIAISKKRSHCDLQTNQFRL